MEYLKSRGATQLERERLVFSFAWVQADQMLQVASKQVPVCLFRTISDQSRGTCSTAKLLHTH
jgi:hypothetical protein